jgi:hypothetical protein
MDIYAKEGTKVIFANPTWGYQFDQKMAAKHLKEGAVYTVERTDVDSWHTDVYLKEVPGIAFNSVHFVEAA